MSATVSTVSVELLFEELKEAISKRRIGKLKEFQPRLSRLVKQLIKTNDLAALILVNQKIMDLILTTQGNCTCFIKNR